MSDERDKKTIFNREWRINHLYKIQTKDNQVITFKRNRAQQIVAEKRSKKNLILKSRQHGVTTLEVIEGLDCVLFRENFTACIIAHKKPKVQEIFRKAKFAFDRLPDQIQLHDGRVWTKPVPKYDNKNELYFPEQGSRFYVDTEVRGDTVHKLHTSEAAFVPDAHNRLGASMEAVPLDGDIDLETTANGAAGYFFELWEEAVEGENEFTPIFLGWHLDPENAIDPPKGFELTTEEEEYRERAAREGITLSLAQMYWRRMKKKRLRHLFEQEYPLTAEEAFLFSGRPVFSVGIVSDWITKPPIPWGQTFTLLRQAGKSPAPTMAGLEGRLKVWLPPKPGVRYVLGADISEGISVDSLESTEAEGGTDYTAIEVLNAKTMQQCAEWRGKWPYHKVHELIIAIGMFYNFAFLGVERNNHGLTVLSKLSESLYPEELIYTEQVLDEKTKKKRKRWGWVTNKVTKPLMIDELAEMIEEHAIKIFSKLLQKECIRFILNDDGSMGAQEGYHDDTVIATAIAVQMRKYALALPNREIRREEVAKVLGI